VTMWETISLHAYRERERSRDQYPTESARARAEARNREIKRAKISFREVFARCLLLAEQERGEVVGGERKTLN
jgi:hypothetical protein